MLRFPSFNLIIAITVVAFGSSYQHGYTYSWTNSAQTVMMEFLQRSFNATYGYELNGRATSLLWSTIVTMKPLGLIIGAEIGKIIANDI